MPELRLIPLSRLRPHPRNSNVMPEAMLEKLVRHLERANRYPPLIVRPIETDASDAEPSWRDRGEATADVTTPPSAYEILDGHHRAEALRRLGREHARCDVWRVGDEDALMLLATLNRLRGHDDPLRRAELLRELAAAQQRGRERLAAWLPERSAQVRRLLAMRPRVPRPRSPRHAEAMPVPVHFFLRPAEKRELDAALRRVGEPRAAALVRLVRAGLASLGLNDAGR